MRTPPRESAPLPDVREYLAAERTFLAYIRTALGLMGFGFVVARFSLFLKEVQVLQVKDIPQNSGLSLWFGTALVVIGVLLNVIAIFEYRHLIARLNASRESKLPAARTPVATALLTALCGAVMAAYLVWPS